MQSQPLRSSMKVGDLVKVKHPLRFTGGDEKQAREVHPWKFELGVITCAHPYGSFPGKEVYVHFPSYPDKTILTTELEVLNESR